MEEYIKVTLIKSPNGRLKNHRLCVVGLGLRRIGSEIRLKKTPSVMGMVNQVRYMLKVE